MTLTAGTGTDPDGEFEDFVTKDEGTQANSWGVVSTRGRAIFVYGTLTIGSSTETDFTDTNRQIFYPDGRFGAGTVGLAIGLQHASSVISITSCTFVGEGREAVYQEFHTNDDVDATNDEMDITAHGFETGDHVQYSKDGGSDSMGLSESTDYWVRKVTDDSISIHTTRQGSFADTSQVSLSQSGGTETHNLTKQTDSRPDMVVTGTSGSATLDACAWLNHRNITFTSGASQDGGTLECKLLTQGSADIENVKIVTSADPGEACLQDPTFGTTTDLHDVTFEQDTRGGMKGHAIELDTATSYTLTNIFFNGYGADTTEQAAIYVSASSGTCTINVSGGDTPTYRTAGATVVIVADPVTTKVTCLDGITKAGIERVAVTVRMAGSGPFPYNASVTSITRSGSVATVTMAAAHNLATNNKIEIIGADQNEYNRIKTITVTGATTFTYPVSGAPATPATGTITATAVLIDERTPASGIVSDSRVFSSDQAIEGFAAKGTRSPRYVRQELSGTVDSVDGVSLTVLMQSDE
jgi:hypothetical protein